MRKDNLIKLGDAINEFLKEEKLDEKLSRFAVKNSWKEIAGDLIASNTVDIGFKEKCLFLTLKSAPLKQEVEYNKDQLIKNINTFCGKKFIEKIIIK